MTTPPPARSRELEDLLGLRSSKGRWYREYRHSRHDLDRTLAAVNAVSWALAGGSGDARGIVIATLPVVASLLDAQAVALVTEHPGLTDGLPVELTATHPDEPPADPELPGRLAALVRAAAGDQAMTGVLRPAPELGGTLLVVPLPRDGMPCGSVAALVPDRVQVDGTDLAILGTVANQLAGAVESAHRLERSATQNRLLRQTRHELVAVRERQVLGDERQRIARDLHDSLAQHVLSIGMQIEHCRLASTDPEMTERLTEIKTLARSTVDRIRQTIFALSDEDELGGGLVPALHRLAEQHRMHGLTIGVRVTGEPVGLPPRVQRALYGAAKEALFNTVLHAEASRASVRLAYERARVRLQVTDNGAGHAADLRAALDRERRRPDDGYHRGLGNIEDRVLGVGGRLRILDASGGGVRLQVDVPAGDRG